jgi:hypothetical protein
MGCQFRQDMAREPPCTLGRNTLMPRLELAEVGLVGIPILVGIRGDLAVDIRQQ